MLQDRIRRAEQAVEVQKSQASASKFQTVISFGAAVLGAFTGRKMASAGNLGRAATAMRGVTRSSRESSDVGRAEDNVQALQQQLESLNAQFRAEVDAMSSRFDAATETLEAVSLKPKKTGISIRAVVLVWAPCTMDAGGGRVTAWT
jgi:hypothetical protein